MKGFTIRFSIYLTSLILLAVIIAVFLSKGITVSTFLNEFYTPDLTTIIITRGIGVLSIITCFALVVIINKKNRLLHQVRIKKQQAESELIILTEKAESAKSSKSNFLSNISHEMRTPLNGILGFSDILLKTELSKEEQVEYLQHIKTSGNILLRLITDILEFNKIETGNIEIKNEAFLFKEFI